MHNSIYPIIGGIMLFFCSCSPASDKQEKQLQKYPNEDAPLALLMREMFLDLEEIKGAVEKGESIKSYLERHQELLEAKPTNPQVKTPVFQLMGEAYLESLYALEQSEPELLKANFKTVLSTCLGCHQQYCPGPIKRIQLLEME
ncbi:MAG: hypothetical protein ACXIUQ_15430 [Cecembia sp.]